MGEWWWLAFCERVPRTSLRAASALSICFSREMNEHVFDYS